MTLMTTRTSQIRHIWHSHMKDISWFAYLTNKNNDFHTRCTRRSCIVSISWNNNVKWPRHARGFSILKHLIDVLCETTTWNDQIRSPVEYVCTRCWKFHFLSLNFFIHSCKSLIFRDSILILFSERDETMRTCVSHKLPLGGLSSLPHPPWFGS